MPCLTKSSKLFPMSHSQWEKKKNKMASQGNKISKLYSKLVRLITVEAKKANGNRTAPGLANAIEKARSVDMPMDNIERAIKKATDPSEALESITYEAYGPGGVGIIIDALTTSRNKAAQEIKHILSLHGSTLGGIGSVTWGFVQERTEDGLIWEPTTLVALGDEDKALLEKMVNDLEDNDEVQDVFTNLEV